MAEKKELVFKIDNKGNIETSINGMKGEGCLELLKKLTENLGEVVKEERTGEFYESEVSSYISSTTGQDENA